MYVFVNGKVHNLDVFTAELVFFRNSYSFLQSIRLNSLRQKTVK